MLWELLISVVVASFIGAAIGTAMAFWNWRNRR